MGDFRVWWALFVAFGVASVLVLRRGHRRWHAARDLLRDLADPARAAHVQRLRREGRRLVWMGASLVLMTGLVFAALLGAPDALILGLRAAAVVSVAAVVALTRPLIR